MAEEREVRRGSGARYILIGLFVFLMAAVIFVLGLATGGGSFLFDRLLGQFGLVPSPSPTPVFVSGETILKQIQQVSRLETTVYTVEQVIEAKQSDPRWPDWLRGDRLLFIAHGNIVVGVDLGQLTEQDVTVSPDGKHVTVRLPPVEIFNPTSILDNTRSRVYDRQQGLLAPPNVDLESQARQAAEGELLASACEDGILERATEDANRAVSQLLKLLEVEVTVESAAAPPCG